MSFIEKMNIRYSNNDTHTDITPIIRTAEANSGDVFYHQRERKRQNFPNHLKMNCIKDYSWYIAFAGLCDKQRSRKRKCTARSTQFKTAEASLENVTANEATRKQLF